MARASAPRMTTEDKKWRAQEDLRTLRVADEIRTDSSRVQAAKRIAKQEMRALTKIAGRGASGKRR